MHSLISFLALAPQVSLSFSQERGSIQHHQTPANNQWKVSNLRIRRFLNPKTLNLGAFFELDRVYYDPCTADIVGDLAQLSKTCGLQSTTLSYALLGQKRTSATISYLPAKTSTVAILSL